MTIEFRYQVVGTIDGDMSCILGSFDEETAARHYLDFALEAERMPDLSTIQTPAMSRIELQKVEVLEQIEVGEPC